MQYIFGMILLFGALFVSLNGKITVRRGERRSGMGGSDLMTEYDKPEKRTVTREENPFEFWGMVLIMVISGVGLFFV